jgi:signal transduction histidine kinase
VSSPRDEVDPGSPTPGIGGALRLEVAGPGPLLGLVGFSACVMAAVAVRRRQSLARRPAVPRRDQDDDRRPAARHERQPSASRPLGRGLRILGTAGCASGVIAGIGAAWRLVRLVRLLGDQVKQVDRAFDRADQVHPEIEDHPGLAGVDLPRLSTRAERIVDRLRARELELEHAHRLASVGQLAAGLVHELRNELFAVKALVYVNREEARAQGLPVDDLNVIEHELRRMEDQLQGLIVMARPTRGSFGAADLAGAVRHAVTLLRGRARAQRVQVETEIPEHDVPVAGESAQVLQVVVNLLQNALEAVPEGGRVGVELRCCERDSAELIVSDDGPGIEPGVLPILFQPFVSSKPNGLGIGLAISRRIAESLGGSLTATNAAGGGARFTFRLPGPGKPPGYLSRTGPGNGRGPLTDRETEGTNRNGSSRDADTTCDR